jgi:hypothetical protein
MNVRPGAPHPGGSTFDDVGVESRVVLPLDPCAEAVAGHHTWNEAPFSDDPDSDDDTDPAPHAMAPVVMRTCRAAARASRIRR